jgi:hypothetical protein
MNYGDLRKDELLKLCRDKKIKTYPSYSKKRLISLLEDSKQEIKIPKPLKQDDTYSTLEISNRRDPLNKKQIIQNIEYVPVRNAGRWKSFLSQEKKTIEYQNQKKVGLYSKSMNPLLEKVSTIFFGDSYARMLEPPPPSIYVVSYPGIPIKSLGRSFTKIEASRENEDWIDLSTLSEETKKKKIFLTFSSDVQTRYKPRKKMFHEFTDNRSDVGMKSYPRIDLFRQILRFPASKLKKIGFWFGNADLQISFYYDLFRQKFMLETVNNLQHFISKNYEPFRDQYIDNIVNEYVRYIETVKKINPKSDIYVMLMNYSPVDQKNFKSTIKPFVDNVVFYSNTEVLNYLFSNYERAEIINKFNSKLLKEMKNVIFMDINPIICNPNSFFVKREFILHQRDIHLADPYREIYKYIKYNLE